MDERLGKYILRRRLGAGGMAEVFLAEQVGPGGFAKQVALKRILPNLLNDDDFIAAFVSEARLGGQLNHPNIVQTLNIEEEGDNIFLTMEYVDGITLSRFLRFLATEKRKPDLSIMLEIARQMTEALAYAHSASDLRGQPLKMVHRDLKPENILMSSHGQVKITDFGVARAESNLNHTVVGNQIKGTVAYMSPEQAMALPIDHRADLFSFGAMLFEMFTLERLYPSVKGYQGIQLVQSWQIFSRLPLLNDLPAALKELIIHLLARTPAERPSSADEVRRELRSLISFYPLDMPEFTDLLREAIKSFDVRSSRMGVNVLGTAPADGPSPKKDRLSHFAQLAAEDRRETIDIALSNIFNASEVLELDPTGIGPATNRVDLAAPPLQSPPLNLAEPVVKTELATAPQATPAKLVLPPSQAPVSQAGTLKSAQPLAQPTPLPQSLMATPTAPPLAQPTPLPQSLMATPMAPPLAQPTPLPQSLMATPTAPPLAQPTPLPQSLIATPTAPPLAQPTPLPQSLMATPTAPPLVQPTPLPPSVRTTQPTPSGITQISGQSATPSGSTPVLSSARPALTPTPAGSVFSAPLVSSALNVGTPSPPPHAQATQGSAPLRATLDGARPSLQELIDLEDEPFVPAGAPLRDLDDDEGLEESASTVSVSTQVHAPTREQLSPVLNSASPALQTHMVSLAGEAVTLAPANPPPLLDLETSEAPGAFRDLLDESSSSFRELLDEHSESAPLSGFLRELDDEEPFADPAALDGFGTLRGPAPPLPSPAEGERVVTPARTTPSTWTPGPVAANPPSTVASSVPPVVMAPVTTQGAAFSSPAPAWQDDEGDSERTTFLPSTPAPLGQELAAPARLAIPPDAAEDTPFPVFKAGARTTPAAPASASSGAFASSAFGAIPPTTQISRTPPPGMQPSEHTLPPGKWVAGGGAPTAPPPLRDLDDEPDEGLATRVLTLGNAPSLGGAPVGNSGAGPASHRPASPPTMQLRLPPQPISSPQAEEEEEEEGANATAYLSLGDMHNMVQQGLVMSQHQSQQAPTAATTPSKAPQLPTTRQTLPPTPAAPDPFEQMFPTAAASRAPSPPMPAPAKAPPSDAGPSPVLLGAGALILVAVAAAVLLL